jgi:hypothetical protein
MGSCAELSDRPDGVCGNGITEPQANEDCDFQDGCVAPGELNACFWSCDAETPCPDGFGCGTDGVCRAPGYDFTSGPTVSEGRVAWLRAADMDGDGRDDLVFVTAEQAQDEGDVSVVFSGPDGTPANTVSWERVKSRVNVGDADGDGLADVLLTSYSNALGPDGEETAQSGFAVLRNDGERGFVPVITPDPDAWRVVKPPREVWRSPEVWSHPLGDSTIKYVHDDELWDLETASKVLSLPGLAMTSTVFDTMTRPEGCFNCGDEFGFAVITGDEHAYAPLAARMQVNVLMAAAIELTFDTVGVHPWIEFMDMNADGLLDVVAQSWRDEIHVAWGQPGGQFHSVRDEAGNDNAFGPAVVTQFSFQEETTALGRVLFAAELNGDAKPDFVMQRGIAFSLTQSCDDDTYEACCGEKYHCTEEREDWSSAVAADLDGDGHPDVVGIPNGVGTNIGVIRGPMDDGGAEVLPVFVGDGATQLATSDLDGDGLEDVLVRLNGPSNGESPDDALRVLWGHPLELDTSTVIKNVGLHAMVTERGSADPGSPPSTDANTIGELAVAGEKQGDDVELGLATIGPIGNRLIGSFSTPPYEEFQGWSWESEYHAAVPGHFSAPGPDEIALAGFTLEFDQEEEYRRTIEKVQTTRLEPSRPGLFHIVGETEWGAEKTPPGFDDPALPVFTSMASTFLAADLDQDGRDELLIVGSLGPQSVVSHVVPSVGGLVGVYGQDGDQWALWQAIQDPAEGLSFGGEWPYIREPQPVEAADLDADGDLDLFAIGALDGVSEAAVVFLNEDGKLELQDERLSRGDSTWRAVSLLGRGRTAAQRLAFVTDKGLHIGSFDVESMSFDEKTTYPAPSGQAITAVGDFNGDGVPDLALGTDNGVQLYFGTATHGE